MNLKNDRQNAYTPSTQDHDLYHVGSWHAEKAIFHAKTFTVGVEIVCS